ARALHELEIRRAGIELQPQIDRQQEGRERRPECDPARVVGDLLHLAPERKDEDHADERQEGDEAQERQIPHRVLTAPGRLGKRGTTTPAAPRRSAWRRHSGRRSRSAAGWCPRKRAGWWPRARRGRARR